MYVYTHIYIYIYTYIYLYMYIYIYIYISQQLLINGNRICLCKFHHLDKKKKLKGWEKPSL